MILTNKNVVLKKFKYEPLCYEYGDYDTGTFFSQFATLDRWGGSNLPLKYRKILHFLIG